MPETKKLRDTKPAGNQNFLGKDGLIYNIWSGNQNSQTVARVGYDLLKIISPLKAGGKSILILSDITNLGKVTWGARQKGYKIMRDLEYDRAAVFGNYFLFRSLVEGIITAAGMGFKVKFFHGLDKALEWLEEDS